MIDREKMLKFLDVMDRLTDEDATLSLTQDGKINLSVYPKRWWSGERWPEEKRHQMLALITPLVGKLDKYTDNRTIGYEGHNETVTVKLCYIDKCQVLGYKTITKTVKKEIEKPVEYEEEEVEERITITDCDIRSGKFKEDDIEVRA